MYQPLLIRMPPAALLVLSLVQAACVDPVTAPPEVAAHRTDSIYADTTPRSSPPDLWTRPAPVPGLTGEFVTARHAVVDAVADGTGTVHVLLAEGQGFSMRFSQRLVHVRLDGGVWSAPRTVARTGRVMASPKLAVDGQRRLHLFWYENVGHPDPLAVDRLLHRQLEAGAWSAVDTLFVETWHRGTDTPVIATGTDAAGAVHVLHYATDGATGARGFVTRVQTPAGWRELPDMRDAGFAAAFEAGRSRLDLAYHTVQHPFAEPPPGQGMTAAHVIAYRTLHGAQWGGRTIAYRTSDQIQHVRTAVDGTGTRHVVWSELDDRPVAGRQAVRLRWVRSADGTAWSSPVTILSAADGTVAPELSVDATGRIHLVFAFGTMQHSRLDGDAWTEPRVIGPLPDAYSDSSFGFVTAMAGSTLVTVWRSQGRYLFASLTR